MRRAFLGLALIAFFAGCGEKPQNTVNLLRGEIADYKAAPSDKKKIQIEDHLAKLDGQVAALEQRDDPKAAEYRSKLESLRDDYEAAKMASLMQDTKKAIQGLGQAFKDGVNSVKDAFQSTNN